MTQRGQAGARGEGAPESRDTGPRLHALSSRSRSDLLPFFTFPPGQAGLSFGPLSRHRTTAGGAARWTAEGDAWALTFTAC